MKMEEEGKLQDVVLKQKKKLYYVKLKLKLR